MMQLRHRARFAMKSLSQPVFALLLLVNDFDRDFAAELSVDPKVNGAHSPLAEQAPHLVALRA